MAIRFRIEVRDRATLARTGVVATERGEFRTPAFLPVGTAATVKGVWPFQLKEMGYECVLANTYHLYLRPGHERLSLLAGGGPGLGGGGGGGRPETPRGGAPQPCRIAAGGGRNVRDRPGGDGPGPPQAQRRGDLPPPVSRIRHRRGGGRGSGGAAGGGGRGPRPPPPRRGT